MSIVIVMGIDVCLVLHNYFFRRNFHWWTFKMMAKFLCHKWIIRLINTRQYVQSNYSSIKQTNCYMICSNEYFSVKLQNCVSVLLIFCWWRIYSHGHKPIIIIKPIIAFIPFQKQAQVFIFKAISHYIH